MAEGALKNPHSMKNPSSTVIRFIVVLKVSNTIRNHVKEVTTTLREMLWNLNENAATAATVRMGLRIKDVCLDERAVATFATPLLVFLSFDTTD